MIALKIVCIIAAVIVVILLIPVRIEVLYGEDGFRVNVRYLFFKIPLLPSRKKKGNGKRKSDRKQRKNRKPEKKAEKKQEKGSKFQLLKEMLPLIVEAVKRLRRKIVLDPLVIRMAIPGKEEPADAAIAYGASNAAVSWIMALLEQAFIIKKPDIRSKVDFQAEELLIYLKCQFKIHMITVLPIGISVGLRALIKFLQWKKSGED